MAAEIDVLVFDNPWPDISLLSFYLEILGSKDQMSTIARLHQDESMQYMRV